MLDIKSVSPDVVREAVEEFVCDSKITDHSRRVYNLCCEIIHNLNLNDTISLSQESEELVYKAAYLHDIGKKIDGSNTHNKTSEELIDFLCGHINNNTEYLIKLKSIVKAHRGKFNPDHNVSIEAAIMRMADKIDKFHRCDSHKAFKKANDTYCENCQKIKEYFMTNISKRIDDFDDFKKACANVWLYRSVKSKYKK